MSTWMCLAVVSSVLSVSLGQPLRTVQTCTNSTSESLKLTCETAEIIHVVSVQYQNMTSSCESPPGGSCVFRQETQADSLYTECNGVATCDMEVQKFWMDTVCGDTTNYKAVIAYECVSVLCHSLVRIKDSLVDVCNNVTQLSKQNVNRLYLASPNYPSLSIASSGTCSCDVTGGNMSVTILEYYFLPVDGVRAKLTLTGDTSTWESFTAGRMVYNSLVMENTDSLSIVFDAIPYLVRKKEVMWLKIEGSSMIQIRCNSPPPTSTMPETTNMNLQNTGSSMIQIRCNSPPPTSTMPETTNMNLQDTGDSDVVLAVVSSVCGVVIVLLLVIVVALLLYFKVVKPLRNFSSSPDETDNKPPCTQYDHVMQPRDHVESPVPRGDVSGTQCTPGIYSGLSPYTNLDHEYGKLHAYSLVGSVTTTRAEDNV